METTRLTNDGQITIPEVLRNAYHWQEGQELIVIDTGDGILLKQQKTFPKTTLKDVAGCLKYQGQPKSFDDIEKAVNQGILEQWNDIS